VLSSIPSPSFNSIGPFRLYGLMIALGVVAAVWISQRRYVARGGHPDDISNIALWAVPGGLIGARLYHVITDIHSYTGSNWPHAFEIWNGGLGIPGGILGGFAAGIWYSRRKGFDIPLLMDVAAPALPLAQAIGRWGNYFNKELYGRPTSLPWGLKIPVQFRDFALSHPSWMDKNVVFQPTFLYESLWDLGVVAVVLLVDRKHRLRRGKLFPLYVGLYFLGRAWVEELRSDEAAKVFGVRWNFILAIVMVVVSVIWILWRGAFRPPGDPGDVVPLSERFDAESGDDGVAEGGPGVEGPGSEAAAADGDQGDVEGGVDPEEGARAAEVTEGGS
jgi:prolipoprotein diacylglyceryl transferase